MCKVYNSVGSLRAIKSHLHLHNINEFKSLTDIIAFQKNYFTYQKQITSTHESIIQQEKKTLSTDIPLLDNYITTEKINIERELRKEIYLLEKKMNDLLSLTASNFIQRSIITLRKHFLQKKIRNKESAIGSKIDYSIQDSLKIFTEKTNRYQYIVSHFADAVSQSCLDSLNELERKKRVIEEVNNFIYGALGEQRVVKELENLPDDYFLINDFSLSFGNPIYNRQENYYIKSIQIDHILVSPAGIFLIETKNWSEESLNNMNLWSPVEQIKKANFALFKILSEATSNSHQLHLDQHHWGKRKIPIRNLIVLTNLKPKEEFQYVKILTLLELPGYIKYFKPTFSNTDTQAIASFLGTLINLNETD